MTAASRCPDSDRLRLLLLGKVPEPEAARLERHVGECRRCGKLLPGLRAEDALVEAMRARPKPLPSEDQHILRTLLSRLRGLRPSQALLSGPASGAVPLDLADFLRPPQAPGEIGRLGPYRVLSLLGQGGMGVVFLAEDPSLRRSVALKVMRPTVASKASARERFLSEARAMAMLEHDHIVTIYQVGEDRGVPFLAMQRLEGLSLEDLLRRQREGGAALTLAQILKLGREIAKGLAAAHRKGLIHRDIKPGNVWLDSTAGGRVKILDFGLARAVEQTSRLTQLGSIVGTPSYMAPEQGLGGEIDGRADLFSLGCLLYRLCAGRLPWQAGSAVDTLLAVASEAPTPVEKHNRDLPPALARLVMRLIARKPQDRPESADAVAAAILAIEREAPAVPAVPPRREVAPVPPGARAGIRTTRPATPPRPPRAIVRRPALARPPRTRWWLVGILAAFGVLLLVFGPALLRPEKPANDDAPPARQANGGAKDDQPAAPAKHIVNSIGLDLALIPPGKFFMGTSAEECDRIAREPFRGYEYPGWQKNESPRHEVRISRGFYLGVYEVTQGQYERVMGANPSANKESPSHPVENVNWDEAVLFCERLTAAPAERKAGRTYRLPSEAEWEYACRAGTTTLFHYGDALTSDQANIDGNSPFGVPRKGVRRNRTVKVGSYAPNAWGLYDMHGNVWEWCLDGQRAYEAGPITDPRGGEAAGTDRILRGGGWASGACRSAFRKARPPGVYRIPSGGFRVACFLVGEGKAR